MILDLSPSADNPIYKGCRVVEIEENRHLLETPLDSAVVIIARNIQDMIVDLPAEEREELVLTGSAPPDIYLTAQSMAGPFFKKVIKLNGKTRVEIEIPQPPPNFQIERED